MSTLAEAAEHTGSHDDLSQRGYVNDDDDEDDDVYEDDDDEDNDDDDDDGLRFMKR